jgi:hypothetical protein
LFFFFSWTRVGRDQQNGDYIFPRSNIILLVTSLRRKATGIISLASCTLLFLLSDAGGSSSQTYTYIHVFQRLSTIYQSQKRYYGWIKVGLSDNSLTFLDITIFWKVMNINTYINMICYLKILLLADGSWELRVWGKYTEGCVREFFSSSPAQRTRCSTP